MLTSFPRTEYVSMFKQLLTLIATCGIYLLVLSQHANALPIDHNRTYPVTCRSCNCSIVTKNHVNLAWHHLPLPQHEPAASREASWSNVLASSKAGKASGTPWSGSTCIRRVMAAGWLRRLLTLD